MNVFKIQISNIVSDERTQWVLYVFLFSTQLCYYLLILQTGIVAYYNSDLAQLWMIPIGGLIGIMLSIKIVPRAHIWMPILLFIQAWIVFFYPDISSVLLFVLGMISGLTAPVLIVYLNRLSTVAAALILSYAFGTMMYDSSVSVHADIAVGLSVVAFVASLFVVYRSKGMWAKRFVSFQDMSDIFVWLLLDATLFEILARDDSMHLWGEKHFVGLIVFFHIVGVLAALWMRHIKQQNLVIVGLFLISYLLYLSGNRFILSICYPIVISYYNVVILYKMLYLKPQYVTLLSLSLWSASGIGLFLATNGHAYAPYVPWIFIAILFVYRYRFFLRHPALYGILSSSNTKENKR